MRLHGRVPTCGDGMASVDDIDVQALFRQALTHDDAVAMRQGIEQLLGLGAGAGLSAEREHGIAGARDSASRLRYGAAAVL